MHKPGILFTPALLLLIALHNSPTVAKNTDYRSPEQVQGATTVTLGQAKALYDEGVMFIDVRSPRLHNRRHITGAHHLDLKHVYNQASLAAVAGKNDAIVIYCSGVKCSRSARASEQAVSWGYTRVYYFRGGMAEWRKAGYPITAAEAPAAKDANTQ